MVLLPRIAIPVPTSIDLEYNRHAFPPYLDAISRAGGEAVPVPLDAPAAEVAAGCEAIVLPGSLADVRPARYGQQIDAGCGPPDLLREAADIALLEHAERLGQPVLGICYGLQSINVWRGGTLLQELGVLPINHAAGRSVAVAHSVLVDPGSQLASTLEPAEVTPEAECFRLPVNSSHHQAVGAVGEGLVITARSPLDGVVEALELAPSRRSAQCLMAVQWHPERSFDLSATSRALFSRLVEAARV